MCAAPISPKRGIPSWLGLFFWILLSFGPAALGAVFTPGTWYAGLNKPSWTPPGWVFGPVWTALYFMMAVAAWRVWQHGGFGAQRRPLTCFIGQLVLNAAWTPLFFGLHLPAAAFGVLLLLWGTIMLTMIGFFRVSRFAGWLLAPYLAWASYAAALNFAIWRLNP